jgi:hypothetical protein
LQAPLDVVWFVVGQGLGANEPRALTSKDYAK